MAGAGGRSSTTRAGRGAAGLRPKRIALAVNVVALAIREGRVHVLVLRRASSGDSATGASHPALPGALVEAEESLETATRRALQNEARLAFEPSHLEQLRAYGDPVREGRHDRRVVSVAYLAILAVPPEQAAATGDPGPCWEPVGPILAGDVSLTSDHTIMVSDAVEHLRHELEHTAVATAFLGGSFTEAELRTVYEVVWGADQPPGHFRLDAPNFHRALTTLSPPILELVHGTQAATGGRPAALYRPSDHVREHGPSASLERPIARPRTGTMSRRVH